MKLHRGQVLAQGFTLGFQQILISMIVNGIIVLTAASIASFMNQRPAWAVWQRRMTGSMLGFVAVLLAFEVPERAYVP